MIYIMMLWIYSQERSMFVLYPLKFQTNTIQIRIQMMFDSGVTEWMFDIGVGGWCSIVNKKVNVDVIWSSSPKYPLVN